MYSYNQKKYSEDLRMKNNNSIKRLPIILDTDPGFNDTMAILMLYKYKELFDIKLICSTAGNTPINVTTRNIQFFAKTFFKGVKLAKGLSQPLVKQNCSDASIVHGDTGLGEFNPGPQKYPYKEDSAKAMYETLKKSKEPITLITLGPMTNVARLLIAYPDIKPKIKEIYSMIGSITGRGNITPCAEFNSYFDPEAFDIVVKSNIPITFNTIELGEIMKFSREKFLRIPSKSTISSMIKSIIHGTNEINDPNSIFMYDVSSVYALIKPEMYKFTKCDVKVWTDSEYSGKCVMTDNPNGVCRYQTIKNIEKLKKSIADDLFSL